MDALIQVMESTIAARDPYTVGHQRRVTQIACNIGREMGLSEDRLVELRIAAMLHDLGKIAIPSGLLSKPGELTPLEFALIKTHPQVAYNILAPVRLPGHTAEIILQHHERLNGSGYPQGLHGHEIFLEARILGVADVMEAMCSHRPYRASLGLAEAMDELMIHRGQLYDTAVVETCLKLYGDDLAADTVAKPPYPFYTGEAVQGQDHPDRWRALPPATAGKAKKWTKRLATGRNAWVHLGTASILGFLLAMTFKGF